MRAVVTEPGAVPRLAIREVARPAPAADQAVVRVRAFSLNAGETRTAFDAATSYTPGWDFAGVVERPAASFAAGARVFGFVPQGSWAEYVAVRPDHIAAIPEGVSDVQAAALPVAGMTAMICLERAGAVLGRRVLVTGAAGGVGRFACQLAALAGASVFAVSRRPELPSQLEADGVRAAGVFRSMTDAKTAGSYDVIIDSVGGDTLATALMALSADGTCINCGNSSRQPTSFDARALYMTSEARLRTVWLGRELASNCTPRIAWLAELVRQGRLRTPIAAELPWTDVVDAAERLLRQSIDGKLVLTVA